MTVVIDIIHTTVLFTVDLPSLKVSVQLFCVNIETILYVRTHLCLSCLSVCVIVFVCPLCIKWKGILSADMQSLLTYLYLVFCDVLNILCCVLCSSLMYIPTVYLMYLSGTWLV